MWCRVSVDKNVSEVYMSKMGLKQTYCGVCRVGTKSVKVVRGRMNGAVSSENSS